MSLKSVLARFLLIASMCAILTEVSSIAQIEFCANRLKGTESGKEEHFLKIYKCDTLSTCFYANFTEQQNMEDDKPWRCWTTVLPINQYTELHKFVKVDIYESDNHGAGDDMIGYSIVQLSELYRLGSITTEVTEGVGQIKFVFHNFHLMFDLD